jgi:hypothetical protein
VSSTAIAKETLSQLKWKYLEEGWEKISLPCINIPAELLKGQGVGRYKGMRQITFLTPEAQKDLIFYHDWLEAKMGCKLTPDDHIFLEISRPYKEKGSLPQIVKYNPLEYDTLGTMICRLSKNAGVKFTWHDARRYVNTALEQIAISSNWAREIRGRSVRGEEAPYSRPAIDQLRAKFAEAVPLLEFMSETPKGVDDRLKALADFKASLTPEQQEQARAANLMFRKDVSEPRRKKEECEDGKHCGEEEYKQVGANKLLQYLKDGWKITHDLPNGEVIICKDSL